MVHAKALAAVAATYFSVTSAHMVMSKPVPFNPDALNNSPLEPSGDDFPCKFKEGGYQPGDGGAGENNFAVGEEQTLSFMGSAVHGGGSCQVSLTTDKKPTKSSKWKVIHSIEGGCPMAGGDDNLDADPNGNGADTFKFKIPEGISAGDYTLAWTWFNRIGNREMYMNCAPIKVTGAKKRRYAPTPAAPKTLVPLSKRADFPEMFLANIGNGCTTVEGKDVEFPNPGESVDKHGDAGNLQKLECGGGGSGGGDEGGDEGGDGGEGGGEEGGEEGGEGGSEGGDGGEGGSEGGDGGEGGGEGGDAPPTEEPAPGGDGGEFNEDPNGAPPTEQPADPPAGGEGGDSGSGSCEDGQFKCVGGSSFQQCAGGVWSEAQPMAAGTTCSGDVSTDLGVAAAKKRRSPLHRRREH